MYQQGSDQANPLYDQPTATSFPVSAAYSTTPPYSTTTASSTNYHQPPPPPKPLVDWSTGLCDCFSDCGNCCVTWWCPCVTFGRVAEIVDKGSTSCGASGALYVLICWVFGCGCLYSCFYRSKMRQQYGLKGNGCTDCLVHCCCERCALGQEYRELEHRGFDMIIGWHGNVEQRSRGVAMVATAPTVEQGMTR